MTDERASLEVALKRQMDQCKTTWFQILEQTAFIGVEPGERRPTALDVGCGLGLGMELFSEKMNIIGLDRSAFMAEWARSRGHSVVHGIGQQLPFPDNSFDIVYCSFVLTWVDDPSQFISEMIRVSKRWVFCLAEPDSASRIDLPIKLKVYTDCVLASIAAAGGNIYIGRQLHSIIRDLGYEPMVGVNAGGTYQKDVLFDWIMREFDWVEGILSKTHGPALASAKKALQECTESGDFFHFTPLFYAVIDKERDRLHLGKETKGTV